MRRWQEFGFAGQFSDRIPQLEMVAPKPWTDLMPLFVSCPHKAIMYENLNYCLGGSAGQPGHVYATYWILDFPNWVAPAADCMAQHLQVGSVIFPGQTAGGLRLFDALTNGFPPYPPLSNYTSPLLQLADEPPSKFGG